MAGSPRGGGRRKRLSRASEPAADVEIIEMPDIPETVPTRMEVFARTSGDDDAGTRPGRQRHDFGLGPVPAAPHTNPDGSTGGWVALTAHVDASAHVGPTAAVSGNARVFEGARVLDQAHVCGNARVYGGSVSGRASVLADATLRHAHAEGAAVISGRANVWDGAVVAGRAVVDGQARVLGAARIDGEARVTGDAWVRGGHIRERAVVAGSAIIDAGGQIAGDAHLTAGRFPRPTVVPDDIDLDDQPAAPAAPPVVRAPQLEPHRRHAL